MIHVKWNRDVLHIPLPPLDTPLGTLRAELASWTQLPAGSFKLVYKGAVMKEDTAPLSTYKLKENATIALIGGGGDLVGDKEKTKNVPVKAKTTPETEAGAISAIRAELEQVRETLVPDVDRFVSALGPGDADPTPTPLDHTRLSELLLQSLLRLDAMYVPGMDWPEARVQRKAAVKEVQGVLDRLDGAWSIRSREG